ncbi:MAG: methyltransferase domain-containing protein [Acidobacteriota bacterium]|nr:methyltransferase domain-containing protein [Acidobacteriota bacterium]
MSSRELSAGSKDAWEGAAAGWTRQADAMRVMGEPVAQWLVDAIDPKPGQEVLELAAGVGETGFMAAARLLPGGRLISTDQAEGMVAAARARAEELGLENVEHRVMGAEWIDLPVASVDAVLCRWGYMLMGDCASALRESRRVLRAGGRIALAVWDSLERNPWSLIPGEVLRARGLAPEFDPAVPGPFALGDPAQLTGLLEGAGFQDVTVGALDLAMRYTDFDSFWAARLDISPTLRGVVGDLSHAELEALRADLRAALAPHTGGDGALDLPARTLVASATA